MSCASLYSLCLRGELAFNNIMLITNVMNEAHILKSIWVPHKPEQCGEEKIHLRLTYSPYSADHIHVTEVAVVHLSNWVVSQHPCTINAAAALLLQKGVAISISKYYVWLYFKNTKSGTIRLDLPEAQAHNYPFILHENGLTKCVRTDTGKQQ